jgi:hypothetical protein
MHRCRKGAVARLHAEYRSHGRWRNLDRRGTVPRLHHHVDFADAGALPGHHAEFHARRPRFRVRRERLEDLRTRIAAVPEQAGERSLRSVDGITVEEAAHTDTQP